MRYVSFRAAWVTFGVLLVGCEAEAPRERDIAVASDELSASEACTSLRRAAPPDVTIDSATSEPAGTFTPSLLLDLFQFPASVPAHCRVVGHITKAPGSRIGFELWLPPLWNGRLMMSGNSGLAGYPSYTNFLFGMQTSLARGYAAVSTDTGHSGAVIDGSWGNRDETVTDNAYRAVHETSVAAKQIVAAYYGSAPSRSYFHGCSTGGRQALLEAQRYPDDFDGIIAGSAINYFTRILVSGTWLIHQTLIDPATYIPSDILPVLARAVLAQCDERDGLVDGLLADPRRCRFDPTVLRCTLFENDNCLTEPQIQALERLYQGPRNPTTGAALYPGYLPGGEVGVSGSNDWTLAVSGALPGLDANSLLTNAFMTGVAFENPFYDIETFDFDEDVAFLDEKFAESYNAVDPDLSEFSARGGKLIMYHGYSDSVSPPANSIHYYQSVAERTGSRATALEFARLFMVPGMSHCVGGTGFFAFDALSALEQWVEQGVAPDQLLGAQIDETGAVSRNRPLCRFPLAARYDGSGSIDDASNFTCERKAAGDEESDPEWTYAGGE